MTELSFLIELLLNHKLPKATKDAVAARIKEIEASPAQMVVPRQMPVSSRDVTQRHPDLIKPIEASAYLPVEQSTPAVIAQTPAAAAALASREAAINASLSGKVDKVSGRPRKF